MKDFKTIEKITVKCKEEVINYDDLRNKIVNLCKQKLASNKTPKVIEFTSKFALNSIGKKVMVSSLSTKDL